MGRDLLGAAAADGSDGSAQALALAAELRPHAVRGGRARRGGHRPGRAAPPRRCPRHRRPATAGTLPDGPAPREAEVLSLIADGFCNAEIADHLVVREATVTTWPPAGVLTARSRPVRR
jgi:DNA-binding NarL/FixJ family response regulator